MRTKNAERAIWGLVIGTALFPLTIFVALAIEEIARALGF